MHFRHSHRLSTIGLILFLLVQQSSVVWAQGKGGGREVSVEMVREMRRNPEARKLMESIGLGFDTWALKTPSERYTALAERVRERGGEERVTKLERWFDDLARGRARTASVYDSLKELTAISPRSADKTNASGERPLNAREMEASLRAVETERDRTGAEKVEPAVFAAAQRASTEIVKRTGVSVFARTFETCLSKMPARPVSNILRAVIESRIARSAGELGTRLIEAMERYTKRSRREVCTLSEDACQVFSRAAVAGVCR